MTAADALRPHFAAIEARAAALDATAAFPSEDIALLRSLGLPAIPLPAALGGHGAGTTPEGAAEIFELLRLLGRANMSLGRLFEAHVNVARLVLQYGTPVQHRAFASACHAGALYGLWVTDPPNQVLTRAAGHLVGVKGPGSGAGHLRHALVTVTEQAVTRMALIELTGAEPIDPIGTRLHGMRASANGTIHLDGTPLPDTAFIGADGDYLREPTLSTGAWRAMAVALGGLDALVDSVRVQLRRRSHAAAPLQQARFGEMLIAQETARLWTREAGQCAEHGTAAIPDQVATVNLARIAVESACLDAMRHAQRALGLAAFVQPNPVERLLRDLATYLRQPAPDDVLTEAARHALAQP